MQSYLDIVENVLTNGEVKTNRTGIDTLSLPNVVWDYDFRTELAFPLLTCRKMPFKSICVENEGYIKGIVSKKWYEDRGCFFWSKFKNPKSNNNDDLGPIYGYQFRRFGEVYSEDDDGYLKGVDQLSHMIKTIKENPHDRRLVLTYWCPPQLGISALPPCHVSLVANVTNGVLHISYHGRSSDLALGTPCDFAGMALFQILVCIECGLTAGKLTALLSDCHIYKNHIEGMKELLKRQPRQLPTLGIKIQDDADPSYKFDIFKWTYKDCKLYNYDPHPPIKFELAV